MAGKSTRITVDLGSDELVKSLKIAAVEHRRTVRDIVVEALEMWLGGAGQSVRKRDGEAGGPDETPSGDRDYKSMLETLNRYRGAGRA